MSAGNDRYKDNAHRCLPCDRDWPMLSAFHECPICRGETYPTLGDPISTPRARAIADAYRAFAAYETRVAAEVAALTELLDTEPRLVAGAIAQAVDAMLAPAPF